MTENPQPAPTTGASPALTRALATIRDLRTRLAQAQQPEAIAVVGIGLRLPGGDRDIVDLAGYRDLLVSGGDALGRLPEQRRERFPDEWAALPQRGGYLEDVLGFDPDFFGISPREARHMDPQHRLLMETAWRALDDAALPADRLGDARVGVFVGITNNEYARWRTDDADAFWTTGTGNCFAAGRLSYTLGLNGPSVAIDTACSSSLVALHQARTALQHGECDVALAAGVNLVLAPTTTELIAATRSLSPDGRCRTFDARANGFARGEGCGVLVLKPLAAARQDGDRIHAVIAGSAVNQDGRSTGFTAPNVRSQVTLLRAALESAGITADDVSAVEAHGTGTALGDPIEMAAMREVLGGAAHPVPVGAVKAGLGHLEAAAGIAGVIRAVLSVKHRETYAVAGFDTLNPRIDLDGSAIEVAAGHAPLPAEGDVHVGVSSFGMSGTNAHVIVRSEPVPDGEPGAVDVSGFELSAHTAAALREYATRVADTLAGDHGTLDYAGLAHTLTAGRARLAERLTVRAASAASAAAALRSWLDGAAPDEVHASGAGDTGGTDAAALAVPPRRVVDAPSVPWQRAGYAPPLAPTAPAAESAPEPSSVVDTAPALDTTPTVPADESAPLSLADLVWESVPAPDASGPVVLAGSDRPLVERLARVATALGRDVTVVPDEVRTDEQWRAYWTTARPAAAATMLLAPQAHELPSCVMEPTPAISGAALADEVIVAVRSLPEGIAARIVTTAARQVLDEVVRADDHGLLHGLLPVLRLDLPDRLHGIVDLPARDDGADGGEDVDLAVAVVHAVSNEDLLAVRDGEAFAGRLQPRPTEPAQPLPVSDTATYVVTGVTGAIGRHVAADLAARGAGSIVAVGRRPRADLDEAGRAALDGLAAVTDLRYVAVDFEDGAAFASALRDAIDPERPVRGVVHAAGSIAAHDATGVTTAGLESALHGKFAAAWWLHTLAAELEWELDFFTATSSVTAVWGTSGYPGYAAANGALDAVLRIRFAAGLPAASIAYGPWAIDGMVGAADLERFARLGVHPVTPAAGLAALAALPMAEGSVVAGVVDWARLSTVMESTAPRSIFGAVRVSAASAPVSPPATSSGDVVGSVRGTVAELLGHDDPAALDPGRGFMELGLDSITAVDLAATLTERLATAVTVADVFGHPSVAALGAALTARLGGAAASSPAPATPTVRPARTDEPAPSTASTPSTAERAERADAHEPIAVVGMAGRFPSAADVDEFWELLQSGRDGVSRVPADRWDADDPRLPMTTTRGGFLPAVRAFDAEFFGIPAREAASLDPGQRLLLESAWHAFEDAAMDPSAQRGSRTGVFVGVSGADYARVLESAGADGLDAYYPTGTALNAGPGRIAFLLGLHGPALAVDTACSSSLVAMHLAVQALRSGQADCALAGGVNVITSPMNTMAVSRAHMLSPDGRCATFSGDANGFVRSEGCGVLVLKRLSDAVRDGDPVRAVIQGSAVNSDGASAGFTAPNPQAQQQVIALALQDAGVDGHDVSYLEAHGTGTELGDPIEIQAAHAAFRPDGAGPPLRVGSVKSNVGHAESAAGVLSVIKTVLSLEHDVIPGNLHCTALNPHIDWAASGVDVVREHSPWTGTHRLAGVSGFGFSGTNAHVVVGAAPERAPVAAAAGPTLLPMSAPTSDALDRVVLGWTATLTTADDADLIGLAATAATGRAHHAHRRAVVATSAAGAAAALATAAPPAPTGHRVGLLFTGQGSQYPGMGRELYETYDAFADSIDRSDAVLRDLLGGSLVELVFDAPDRDRLDQTWLTQPALLALELATADLWTAWGLTPVAAVGHSVGEVAAAIAAGVLDRTAGLHFIARRARLMQDTAPGGMVGVQLPLDDVLDAIADRALDVAAVNGPRSVVVAGARDELDTLVADLGARGVKARPLAVTRAFHSRLMDPILPQLRDSLAGVTFGAGRYPVIANVTGEAATEGTYTPDYWADHVRRPVRFADGARSLMALGVDFALEVGPDRTLSTLMVSGDLIDADRVVPSMQRGHDPRTTVLHAARTLYEAGVDLDWSQLQRGTRRGGGPRYPFARTEHWIAGAGTTPVAAATPAGPHYGTRVRSPQLHDTVFATERSAAFPPYLNDHRLYGTVVTPAASHLATLLSAIDPHGRGLLVEDFICPRALSIQDHERFPLQLVLTGEDETSPRPLLVASLLDEDAGTWQEHIGGTVTVAPAEIPATVTPPDRSAFAAAADRYLSGADFYAYFKGLGYDLGPSFRWIDGAWVKGTEALVRYRQPELPDPVTDYQLYPGLIDSCFQSIAVFTVADAVDVAPSLAIPFAAGALAFPHRPAPGEQLWGHVHVTESDELPDGRLQVSQAQLHMFTDDGTSVMIGERFRVRQAPKHVLQASLIEPAGVVHTLDWQALPDGEDQLFDGRALTVRVLGGAGLADAVRAAGHTVCDEHRDGADVVLDGRLLDAPQRGASTVRELSRGVLADVLAAPADVPYVVVACDAAPAAPARDAVFGMLAAAEREQPDRTLVRLQVAGHDTATITAGLLAGLPDRTRLRWQDGWSVRHLGVRAGDPDRSPTLLAGRDGAAVITGGLGALGLALAGMLAERGCPAITLVSRSAPDDVAQQAMDRLRDAGTQVTHVRASAEDTVALADALAGAAAEHPLTHVFHLAGTNADAAMEALTPAEWERTFAGKAGGADALLGALDYYTDQHADTRPADQHAEARPGVHLVLFSSVSAALGSAGQTNYAAANGYLDGLAVAARAAGHAVTSVNWGPWTPGERGGLAATAAAARAAEALGVRALDDDEARQALSETGDPVDGRLVVVALDPAAYATGGGRRGAQLLGRTVVPPAPSDVRGDGWLRDELRATEPPLRDDALRTALRAGVGRTIGDPTLAARGLEIDGAGFNDLGMDSIMVIDLRRWLSAAVATTLPATVALDHSTIERLSAYVLSVVFADEPAAVAAPPAAPSPATVETASPDEAAASEVSEPPSLDDLIAAAERDLSLEV